MVANKSQAVPAAGTSPVSPPILLLDVMDTIVYDPFYHDMPKFFGLTLKELLAAKHPTAWIQVCRGTIPPVAPARQSLSGIRRPDECVLAPQFERNEIDEDELFRIFFADGRSFDGSALKQYMVRLVAKQHMVRWWHQMLIGEFRC
jgi:hypothetical protein